MSAPTGSDLLAYVGAGAPDDPGTADAIALTAARFIEKQTGLVFDYGQHVRYEDGGRGRRSYDRTGAPYQVGGRTMFLSMQDWTVDEVATRIPGGSWQVVDATEWEQLGRRLKRADGLAWPAGEDNIRITWTGGFDADNPMPDDLRGAILTLGAMLFRSRKMVRPMLPDGQFSIPPDRIPPLTRAVIGNYQTVHGL